MYITHIASYIPTQVIGNEHFSQLNGLSDEWILARTGIRERRKAAPDENTNTLALKALEAGIAHLPFPTQDIDLIVGGTYTPYDTIHTLAHAAQNYLKISDIPVVSISTACSSFLNAMEIVQGYFAMNKASKALVLVADHNTAYSDERDTVGGHLWGDAGTAIFVTKERIKDNDWQVIDIFTAGAGNVGKSIDGVFLRPNAEGFKMNAGKDVFANACQYMAKATQDILQKNGFTIDDLAYFSPHQANWRITKNVAEKLGLPEEKALSNIQYLGNTGCAGCSVALWENKDKFKPQDLVAVTVFGGGYSYGAMLLKCL
jgi:3-oxoacyl-[acyl-carrier-protein] synthase-3